MENKMNIKDLTLEQLEGYIVENKMPKFRAVQIFEWIYKDVSTFKEMKNLPANIIEKLEADFFICRAEIIEKQVSNKDTTKKYLLRFEDGSAVECVLMDYTYGKAICISTQVGCKMGCTFCASAYGGLTRNLGSGEMIEQIMAVSRDINERISNIVLMGTGEPFDNYEEVIRFLNVINAEKGMNVGMRHITISTCGIIPAIVDFADKKIQATLAISLHAADNETRSKLMPMNKKYDLHQIIDACYYYIKKTNKRITFEYALIKDVNDTNESAEKLGKLLRGMLCHVNLIPVNRVAGKEYERTVRDTVNSFKEILERYGVETSVRRELGSDIDAACGQLRQKHIEKNY